MMNGDKDSEEFELFDKTGQYVRVYCAVFEA